MSDILNTIKKAVIKVVKFVGKATAHIIAFGSIGVSVITEGVTWVLLFPIRLLGTGGLILGEVCCNIPSSEENIDKALLVIWGRWSKLLE